MRRAHAIRGPHLLGAAAVAAALVLLIGVLLWPGSGEDPPQAFIGPVAGNGGAPATTAVRSIPGPTYDSRLPPPTRDKPQSKVWHHDDAWWALMVDAESDSVHVFELTAGDAWRDTGTVVDGRADSTADALWDDGQLHVATRAGGRELRYLRYAYDPQRRSYDVLPGFPVVIDDRGISTVALALDGSGRAWMGYVQAERVQVASAEGADGLSWSAPSVPVGEQAHVTADDQASITAYGDGRIGLLWSNQRTGEFSFTSRADNDPTGEWEEVETPVSGPDMSDGHVQLAAHSDGRLFAVVKTSRDDVAQPLGRDPLVLMLVRDAQGGWTTHVAGSVGEDMTRPLLVLSESANAAYLFAAAPNPGGRIFLKVSALDGVRFASGPGTAVMGAEGAVLNNPTSTTQQVTGETGLVILASDLAGRRYHHVRLPVGDRTITP